MKKISLFLVLALVSLISLPAMSQGTALSTVPNVKLEERQSNFIKFVESSGNYIKLQSLEACVMKLASVGTLGGYTLRAERFTDLATNKSVDAIKVTPNSATGIGKLVSGATGLGSASQTYYIDFDELDPIMATIGKMKAACETEPSVNTTFTYVTRGGFVVSLGYVVNAKKAVKLGQIGQAGEVPFIDFLKEFETAFTTAKSKFAELK